MKSFTQLVTEVIDDNDFPTETLLDGTKVWRDEDDELHRDGGKPAVIRYTRGGKDWYKHGRLHRLDGPARELDGSDLEDWCYYINGRHYSKDAYWAIIKKFSSEDIEAATDALDV